MWQVYTRPTSASDFLFMGNWFKILREWQPLVVKSFKKSSKCTYYQSHPKLIFFLGISFQAKCDSSLLQFLQAPKTQLKKEPLWTLVGLKDHKA
jgi:hypothetical protein